jgi:Mg-chelatase subunit ChlD/type II secretory pathway pseudopilin PulG
MNPEKPSREEIEAKLTALLLDELPAEEAQLLRWAISQDVALAQLHDRLKLTIGFVREVAAHPADATPAQTTPLKLSDERREKLLAHFKTVAPREFVPLVPPLKKRREISPLLAIAAAIALVAVLAAMLLPALASAKRKAQNISAASQAREQEINARLAADDSLATPTPAAPPAVSEQRMASLEARFQNGDSTANRRDSFQKQNQTTIVLPAGGTDDKKLVAASPAPTDTVNSFGSFSLAGGGGSGGSERHGGAFAGPVGNGGDSWQAPVLAAMPTAPAVAPSASEAPEFQFGTGNNSAGQLDNKTISGELAINGTIAQPNDDKSRFYRDITPDSGAGKESKVPMLGDLPVMGSLFQGSPTSGGLGAPKDLGELYSTTPAGADVTYNGTLNVPKSENDNKALGFDWYLGNFSNGTVVATGGSSPTLTMPDSTANPLGQFPVNTAASQTTASATDRFFTAGLADPAKDGNGKFAFDDSSGQLNRSRNIDQFGIARANLGISAAAPSAEANFATTNSLAFNWQFGGQETADSANKNLPISTANGSYNSPVRAPLVFQNSIQAQSTPQNQTVDSFAPAPNVQSPVLMAAQPAQPVSKQSFDTAIAEDSPIQKTPSPAPVPQPEILTRENAFSTFSLNVSDVSFKLAAASLEKGQLPDAASIRSEEFINAFDYRDPEPAAGVPVAFVAERARDPFAHNRDLLRFSIKTAAAGRQPGRPLNIVLLLDNSGSMERADRVAIIHEALKVLASQLQPQDTISIVTFARTARLWVDGARGDQAGDAVSKVSDLTPEGGTNLEEAMNLAYATARRHYLAKGANRVVLLTDGAANLGNVDPEALKQKVEAQRKQGIALDCFGIGWEGYNDDLLEVLSSNGDGRYGFINTPEAATTEFAAQLAGALHVAAEDVKVQVEFNPQRVISYRQIGYAKHQLTKEQFRDNTVAAAPLAAREAGNALYTVEVNPQGEGPVATVRVRFKIPGTTDVSEHEWEVPFDGTAPALEKSSPALRLAATASAFSEWLASSPYAQEVTTDQLLNYLSGVPAIYGADPRPKQLETMIREAKSISGK